MVILAFDTSGPFCDLALWQDDRVFAEAHAEMAKGQAETLMPMMADMMAEAGIGRRHLSAIGVGIGPGNFTGLRISVAAARGMALALNIPAIGISGFERLLDAAEPPEGACLLSLPAPRDQVYLHLSETSVLTGDGWLASPGDPQAQADQIIGSHAETLSKSLGGIPWGEPDLPRPAPVIARLAAGKLSAGNTGLRPAPLYIRAPDAAPSRIAPPVMLS